MESPQEWIVSDYYNEKIKRDGNKMQKSISKQRYQMISPVRHLKWTVGDRYRQN